MSDAYSVTELTAYIRRLFDDDPHLQGIWVQGEVSNFRRAPSGHWYFTLKDDQAQLKCVMWRSSADRQDYIPADGEAVQAWGRVSVYDAQGVYQLYADLLRPTGVGDWFRQFVELKARLEAEGLFDPARKRPLPAFPRIIGIVTSPEAAAFQDIQNVLRRRFPLAQVILSPTLVQGAEAPAQIAAALERLNAHTQADVILVCRGGGSIEDLWAFNDERVARAIAASRIPVITGVGHETDFTIADFAADLRAPTPSAAAEIATPDRAELAANVRSLDETLAGWMQAELDRRRDALAMARRALGHLSPASQVRGLRQRVDDLNARLVAGWRGRSAVWRERLAARAAALAAANPQSILARGYAIVSRSEDGRRLTGASGVRPGTGISIQFGDGDLKARVEDRESHERYTRTLF